MELENRMENLEREVAVLKGDIQATLVTVQESLSKKPQASSQWQKKAWVLALLNLLLAITLFTNIRFYVSDALAVSGSLFEPWLRAFWVALAFLWLLLQMYPLALLLEQENERPRKVAWRNAVALFVSNPKLIFVVTLVVLAIALVSMLFPSLWFVVTATLLVVVCVNVIGQLLRQYRREVPSQ